MNSNYLGRANLKLVTGPSRGGKSRWAEHLIKNSNKVVYIATLDVIEGNDRWNERIIKHKSRRPTHWKLVEGSKDLHEIIRNIDNEYSIIIDSLGGFVTTYLHLNDKEWSHQVEVLSNCLSIQRRLIVIVIEETGWGIVPITPEGNLFRDRLGSLAQTIEKYSVESWLVIQGRAIDLHKISIPIL